MSLITMMPIVDSYELQNAVNLQFGCDIKDIDELLFGECRPNDSYASFSFDCLEVYAYPRWQDEEEIRLRNLVRTYLQDILPDYSRVLININW